MLTVPQTFEAIILEQFKAGPGCKKICAGEYELFNTFDSTQIICGSEFQGLTPGMSITMAIVVGLYDGGSLERCPRPGCKSVKFTPSEAGGKTWYVPCDLWQ